MDADERIQMTLRSQDLMEASSRLRARSAELSVRADDAVRRAHAVLRRVEKTIG